MDMEKRDKTQALTREPVISETTLKNRDSTKVLAAKVK